MTVKTTDLTELLTPALADLLTIVDITADESKKMTAQNFMKIVNLLTALTTPALDDVLSIYDDDGAEGKKITPDNFLKVINLLTSLTSPVADDTLLIHDTSLSVVKKITPIYLMKAINLLTALVAIAADDVIPVYDTSVSSAKKVTFANLEAAMQFLKGDGTAGRVMRSSTLSIQDATTAGEIKVTLTSAWNGDAIATQDDLGKGETAGNFTLDSNGQYLKIEAAGLSGNGIAVLSADITRNDTGTAVTCYYDISSNDPRFLLRGLDGGAIDLTTFVDTNNNCDICFIYLTDA